MNMSNTKLKISLPCNHLQEISQTGAQFSKENDKGIDIQDLLQFLQNHHLKKYTEAVGVVIKEERIDQQLKTVHLGTAVAIGARILITCNHNVHPTIRETPCIIKFIPGIQYYQESKQYNQYIGIMTEYNFIHDNLQDQSSIEELAMILLDRDLQTDRYCRPTQIIENEDKSLCIVGYPENGKEAIRIEREGTLIEVKNGIIVYDVVSWNGSSGSPIFLRNNQGEWYYCGVHTHRGESFKQGVGFTRENLDILAGFADKLISSISSSSKFMRPQSHLEQMNSSNLLHTHQRLPLESNQPGEDQQINDISLFHLNLEFEEYLNVKAYSLQSF